MVQAMKGRRLPALSRIEISIISEQVPELLAFDQGDLDYVALAGGILSRVVENGKLKPEYAQRGISHFRVNIPALIYTYFNQDDPVIGGNAPERIALRRAIALGFDTNDFIKVFYGGQASPANQILPPGVFGHDTSLPQKAIYDPAAARALLDRFGYKDRDGDGMRETPDGKPLVLVQSSTPDSDGREADALWLRSMAAIGLKMTINTKPFNELLKQSQAGQLMMFNLGFRAGDPSGYDTLVDALGQGVGHHQSRALPQCGLRRRLRALPAHAGPEGTHGAGPEDVRPRQRVRAADAAGLPDREFIRAAVAARLLSVAVRLHVEVHGHRSWQASRRNERAG